MLILLCLLILAQALPTPLGAANLASAKRGAELLTTEGCVECHQFTGPSASGALSRFWKQGLTPTRLAGRIWGHGPLMWQNIERAGVAPLGLGRNDAFDLIAYFAASGYFEQPGDAKRGARTYVRQGCARCHAAQGTSTGGYAGPPVAQWSFAGDAVELFHAMWRHAPIMKSALENRNMIWPSLSGQEMADILAWGRPLMNVTGKAPELAIGDSEKGRKIFAMKQCVVCHAGKRTLEDLPYEHTLTELAAVLWNHAPMMMALPPSLNRQELADIVAYLWTTRYFEEPGSVAKGRSLFETKRCAACHSSFTAGVDFDAAAFIAAMWKHGPDVLAKARGLGIVWPAFANREMADLIAFANSIRRPAVVK